MRTRGSTTHGLGRATWFAALVCTAAMLWLAADAGAAVTPSIDVALSDLQLGAHADTTVTLDFDYGGADPTLYPAPSDWRESVKQVVVDTPAGMVGNANAIPYDERCDPDVFETGLCADSSTVGDFTIDTTVLAFGGASAPPPATGASLLDIAILPQGGLAGSFTRMSLLKTLPEVPATIGILVQPPFPTAFGTIHTTMQISPDVNTDLKLRTITQDTIDNNLTSATAPFDAIADFRINEMKIKFLGVLPNGNAFMTNPTRCEKWASNVYASAHYVNDNVDSNPLGGGGNAFKQATAPLITPDCTNQTALPFPIGGTTTINSPARGVSPDFDFTINESGVQANGQSSTTPRTIVTTVPASINVDVLQLGRICTDAQFVADACPATTKVGTVAIETPLIQAGLSGDVYLVTSTTGRLPDLGMQIRGAIHFTQRGANRYVGVKGNQIQTTFNDIPQVGFSKLNVHLFGGPDGLLRTLACPTSNKQPQDGAFTYQFTSYAGQVVSSSTALKANNCFGIQKLRRFGCVYRLLRFQPTYTSRARIKRVYLYIDGRRAAVAKHVPFQFRKSVRKISKGRHKFKLKAVYDDGTVSIKKSTFKRC